MISAKLFRPAQFSSSGTLHEWIVASACFSGVLLIARMIATQSTAFLFLPWNLFLAFIPYWISWWMMRNVSIIEHKLKRSLFLTVWLLFIPNSFYIITDFCHLSNSALQRAPKWFDRLLLFSFAWNGIVVGIVSLRRVETIITLIRGKAVSILTIAVIMWLCAFGIYIGRFLRYNSWDIITNPFSLAGEIIGMMLHPFENAYAWGMTLCYAAFMLLIYFTIKKLSSTAF